MSARFQKLWAWPALALTILTVSAVLMLTQAAAFTLMALGLVPPD